MDNFIVPDFGAVARDAVPLPPKRMLEVKRDGNQTLVVINSSSLGLIKKCARKSFYSLHEGYVSRQQAPALVFGTAYHKALEVFRSHPRSERELPPSLFEHASAMVQGHEAPIEHYAYEAIKAFIKAGEGLSILPDTDKRSISAGVWNLCHYMCSYWNDQYVIHQDADGPFVERAFEFTLYEDKELRIDLHGQIDFVLRSEVTNEILCGDYKTTSIMGADFMSRLKPNHQYTFYLLAAQKVYGITSDKFMVEGIQTKAKPLTARGGPPTFIRQITTRTPEDMLEFKEVILDAVNNYLRWEATGVWPLGDVDTCAMWGGCSFLDVCAAPSQLRENILSAKFERPNG